MTAISKRPSFSIFLASGGVESAQTRDMFRWLPSYRNLTYPQGCIGSQSPRTRPNGEEWCNGASIRHGVGKRDPIPCPSPLGHRDNNVMPLRRRQGFRAGLRFSPSLQRRVSSPRPTARGSGTERLGSSSRRRSPPKSSRTRGLSSPRLTVAGSLLPGGGHDGLAQRSGCRPLPDSDLAGPGEALDSLPPTTLNPGLARTSVAVSVTYVPLRWCGRVRLWIEQGPSVLRNQ
jgi:hypothetical protein